MIIRYGNLYTIMQQQEEEKVKKPMEKEQQAPASTPTGKALLLVQSFLYLHHLIQSSIPQNLGFASKVTTLAMDSMFFFTDRSLHLQAVFRVTRKNSTVEVGYLWYLGCILCHLFFVPYFVMLIVNKPIAYCLFLYTISSVSLQCL